MNNIYEFCSLFREQLLLWAVYYEWFTSESSLARDWRACIQMLRKACLFNGFPAFRKVRRDRRQSTFKVKETLYVGCRCLNGWYHLYLILLRMGIGWKWLLNINKIEYDWQSDCQPVVVCFCSSFTESFPVLLHTGCVCMCAYNDTHTHRHKHIVIVNNLKHMAVINNVIRKCVRLLLK